MQLIIKFSALSEISPPLESMCPDFLNKSSGIFFINLLKFSSDILRYLARDNSTLIDCGSTLQLNTYNDANIAQSKFDGLLPFSKIAKS